MAQSFHGEHQKQLELNLGCTKKEKQKIRHLLGLGGACGKGSLISVPENTSHNTMNNVNIAKDSIPAITAGERAVYVSINM